MRRLGFLLLVLLAVTQPAVPAAAREVQRVVSPGGIEAWLIENPDLPIIALSFSFTGGSAMDPPGKEGRANLASALLDQGAGPLDTATFRQELADLAIDLSFSAGAERLSGGLRTTSGTAERAFELLRLALTEPRFEAEDIERLKEATATGIRRRVSRPGWLTRRAFLDQALPGHPYGRPARGRIDTLRALTADDLRAFTAETLVTSRLTIGVAGDITAEELGRRLDEIFGSLPEGMPADPLPQARLRSLGRTILVDFAGPQSQLYLAQPGLAHDDPDYYAAVVMSHILGGGFSSRLTREVRESRGLTYGISSSLVSRDYGSMIDISADVSNANVNEALAVIRAEWERMAREGASEAEVEDAIAYLTGSFPLALTNTGAIAGALHAFQVRDRGIDYLDRRNALIRAVDRAAVNRIAARLLDPDALVTVVTGAPSGTLAADILISSAALARRELGERAD